MSKLSIKYFYIYNGNTFILFQYVTVYTCHPLPLFVGCLLQTNTPCFPSLFPVSPTALNWHTRQYPLVVVCAVREYTLQSILLDPLYFLVLGNKVFLPSFSFFGFMRTMFSSLLSTIYIYNTSTGYSRTFEVFYKFICFIARG